MSYSYRTNFEAYSEKEVMSFPEIFDPLDLSTETLLHDLQTLQLSDAETKPSLPGREPYAKRQF